MVDLMTMVQDVEGFEITLMPKVAVNLFQIPPVASSKGHCAEDWRGKQFW